MQLFLFEPNARDRASPLKNILEKLTPENGFCAFDSVEALVEGLRRPFGHPPVGVLSLTGREDLAGLTPWRKLLSRARLVIILAEPSPDAVALAHALRPRFLTSRSDDPVQVREVCEKMLSAQAAPEVEKKEAGCAGG
ncbi:MAG: hypothetical protein V1816_15025 [Pseudomonadota bacterium]